MRFWMCVLILNITGAYADTLSDVKARGFVHCGVTNGVEGFSAPDEHQNWAGLEVDYCRALAAAIFDDPQAVRFVPLQASERFEALLSGEIDVLAHMTTWTMARDVGLGVNFVGVMFYDGQAFMVSKGAGVQSVVELSGKPVCVQARTTSVLNAQDYFKAKGMEFVPLPFDGKQAVFDAYAAGECEAMTAASSALAAQRTRLENPDNHMVLPEIISKQPLGPAVSQADDNWVDVARWTYFALLNAEELGVTSTNVDSLAGTDVPAIKRLLGVEGDFGVKLGLTKDWIYRVIRHVGNYGEIYERNLGKDTALSIPRGINELYPKGVHFAPPVR